MTEPAMTESQPPAHGWKRILPALTFAAGLAIGVAGTALWSVMARGSLDAAEQARLVSERDAQDESVAAAEAVRASINADVRAAQEFRQAVVAELTTVEDQLAAEYGEMRANHQQIAATGLYDRTPAGMTAGWASEDRLRAMLQRRVAVRALLDEAEAFSPTYQSFLSIADSPGVEGLISVSQDTDRWIAGMTALLQEHSDHAEVGQAAYERYATERGNTDEVIDRYRSLTSGSPSTASGDASA